MPAEGVVHAANPGCSVHLGVAWPGPRRHQNRAQQPTAPPVPCSAGLSLAVRPFLLLQSFAVLVCGHRNPRRPSNLRTIFGSALQLQDPRICFGCDSQPQAPMAEPAGCYQVASMCRVPTATIACWRVWTCANRPLFLWWCHVTANAAFGLFPTPWPDIASTGLLGAIEGQKHKHCKCCWLGSYQRPGMTLLIADISAGSFSIVPRCHKEFSPYWSETVLS